MPKYNITSMTKKDFRKIIAAGDDNQIRVKKDGTVFLSQDIVAADNLDEIDFRYEKFDAGNDYVGKDAAEDNDFIDKLYNSIIDNWKSGCKQTYVDNWNITIV